MKEFDLQKAKAGAPICTRDGKPARIVCWDFKDNRRIYKGYKIIALIEEIEDNEEPYLYNNKGERNRLHGDTRKDLMMATVKHDGWVLIDPEGPHCIAHIYDTKEEAEEDAEREIIAYSAIAHIEWEE